MNNNVDNIFEILNHTDKNASYGHMSPINFTDTNNTPLKFNFDENDVYFLNNTPRKNNSSFSRINYDNSYQKKDSIETNHKRNISIDELFSGAVVKSESADMQKI